MIDIHCHLGTEDFFDGLSKQSVASVMNYAKSKGVVGVVACGSKREHWSKLLQLESLREDALISLGIHPWHLNSESMGHIDELEQILIHHPNIGIGECGLDFSPNITKKYSSIGLDPYEDQIQVFIAHLELAQKFNRPLSVHCFKAWDKFSSIIDQYYKEGHLPKILVHGFSGSIAMANFLENRGVYLSFNAMIMKSKKQLLVAKQVKRPLLESDGPNCPMPNNAYSYPGQIPELLSFLSIQKGIAEELFATQVNRDTLEFLGVLGLKYHKWIKT
jgi:TatD DNase family protein